MKHKLYTALVATFLFTAVASAQTRYEVTMLPRPAGFNMAIGQELTNRGYVAAIYQNNAGASVAYRHDPDGTPVSLSNAHETFGIMDRGVAVGGSYNSAPLAWLPGGKSVTLAPPPGLNFGYATDINDFGVICGSVKDSGGLLHAVMWRNGFSIDLGGLGGITWADKIADNGHVVGYSWDSNGTRFAFYFDGNTTTYVNPAFSQGLAILEAVNDIGQATGMAMSAVPAFPGFVGRQGFIYDHLTGTNTPLGFLGPWGYFTQPNGIDNDQTVVGFALFQPPNSNWVASGFLWKNGTMYDLNDLTVNLPQGARIITGKALNDDGQVLVGIDMAPGTTDRQLGILTPIHPGG